MATRFASIEETGIELSHNQRVELSVYDGVLHAVFVNPDGDHVLMELTVKDLRASVAALSAYLPPVKAAT